MYSVDFLSMKSHDKPGLFYENLHFIVDNGEHQSSDSYHLLSRVFVDIFLRALCVLTHLTLPGRCNYDPHSMGEKNETDKQLVEAKSGGTKIE